MPDKKHLVLSSRSLLTKREIRHYFFCTLFCPTFDNILLGICQTKCRVSMLRGCHTLHSSGQMLAVQSLILQSAVQSYFAQCSSVQCYKKNEMGRLKRLQTVKQALTLYQSRILPQT